MSIDLVKILYEDDDLLIVNKPAGLIVHSDGRTEEPTLVDWILKKYPKIKEVGEPMEIESPDLEKKIIYRPGIVHRIDRDTSGVLVVAKNQDSFHFIKTQFQDRTVEKVYRAFVYGEMKKDEGVIDRPISRSRKDFRLWSAQRGGKGVEREAITEYKVLARSSGLESFKDDSKNKEGFSFIEARPKTGRTHQIRVHMKAINHPVVCDKLYAPKKDCALGFSRLALHAFSIELDLPGGKRIKIEAPYPEDFDSAANMFI